MPFISLFRFDGSPEVREARRNSLQETAASKLFDADCPPSEATIIVGIAEPRELNLYREGDDFSPPFDLAIEAEYSDAAALSRNMEASRLADLFSTYCAYRTERTVKKGAAASERLGDGEIAGVRMLHPLRFHPDLPRSALLRSWRDIHGDLAVKAHSGAYYYAQLLVIVSMAVECQASAAE